MRRYAKVSPRLWTGVLGIEIRGDEATQIVAFYLLSSPHSNSVGLYRLPLAYVAADTGLSEDRIKRALERLDELGFCHYDAATSRVWVVEAARHEMNGDLTLKAGDNRLKAMAKLLEDNASSHLVARFGGHYPELYELCQKGLEKPLPKPLRKTLRSQEQEQEQEQEQLHVGPDGPTGGRVSGQKKDSSGQKSDMREAVERVFAKHLEARERFFRWKNGYAPPIQPQLTSTIARAIRTAIEEYDEDIATDAGIGMFWSDHHIGDNDREKEYLAPELCWRITKEVDNVYRFAELARKARARKGEFRE